METANSLLALDRCPRNGFWSQTWESERLHPNEILRRAVDVGLMSEEDDPGQAAGDHVMTLCAERGLDVEGSGVYDLAMHYAALSDLITTTLRAGMTAYARPADMVSKTLTWESAAFLEPSGLKLRRVLLVDRWSPEREQAEIHSWKGWGEVCVYGMPQVLTVVIIGQRRDGKHHSPWSKGFLHPRSRHLRIRKRDGETFGGEWKPVWREEADWLSRDKWLDAMREDQVMHDLVFEKEIPVPPKEVIAKVVALAEKKLTRLQGMMETPEPSPSVCWGISPCQFVRCCWEFSQPGERTGYVPLSAITSCELSSFPALSKD